MYVSDVNEFSEQLLADVVRKVNALGHQPRVIVELDQLRYVRGVKAKFPVIDYVTSTVTSTYDMYDPTEIVVDTTTTTTGGGTEEVTAFPDDDRIVNPLMGKTFAQSVVTSNFGQRSAGLHKGLDIDCVIGDPICAAWAGKVTVAGAVNGYGKAVYIDHGGGVITRYGHLDSVSVSVNDTVSKGQLIAKGGNTGTTRSSTGDGSHLHFEIRKHGNPIDPKPVLKGSTSVKTSVVQSTTTETKANVKTVVSEEAVTFYRDFNIPVDTAVDTKFKDFVRDPKVISATDDSGAMKKIFGFQKVSAGLHKSFSFEHTWNRDGYFDFDYFANMPNDKDIVKVYMDGKVILELHGGTSGQGAKGWVDMPKIKVTKGAHKFTFNMSNTTGSNSIFGVTFLKAAEFTKGTDPKQSRKVEYSYDTITEKDSEAWYDIGSFVLQDTFYLENDIIQWEINEHFDQGSATASVTLDNVKGIYSPDFQYNSDAVMNSELSYLSYVDNGRVRHTISEGTPVRIYVGYGDNVVRGFTGRIKGEVEEDSVNRTVTFKCVDMYDIVDGCVLYRPVSFPEEDDIDVDSMTFTPWLKSAIVQFMANFAGMAKWRVHYEDLHYPDFIITDTYYTDIREDSKTVIKFIEGVPTAVPMETIKTSDGYKNPFVETIRFEVGERVSDAIQKVIGDINFRAYCDRNGTFRLHEMDYYNNYKWDLTDDTNIQELSSSIDYSRIRNHLMLSGANGLYEHFFDKDLIIATKGQIRSAGLNVPWIDETLGDARSAKQIVAERLFFDMKRIARTKNIVIKGNPMIQVMDGVFVKDEATSTADYYIVKGNRLTGNKSGMVNYLEVTWREDV